MGGPSAGGREVYKAATRHVMPYSLQLGGWTARMRNGACNGTGELTVNQRFRRGAGDRSKRQLLDFVEKAQRAAWRLAHSLQQPIRAWLPCSRAWTWI